MDTQHQQEILAFVYQEGYATTSLIHDTLFRNIVSIQTARGFLRDLVEGGLLSYKELPVKNGKGSGERVFHLTQSGLLETLGNKPRKITAYLNSVQSIRSNFLKHFLLCRKIEKYLTKQITKNGKYDVESLNEFHHAGKLQVKMAHQGKTLNIRSDGRIIVRSKQGFELLTMNIEVDRSTEPLNSIVQKCDSYFFLSKTDILKSQASTFPVFLMFISESADRITNMVEKLKAHKSSDFLLFLPFTDQTEKADLFSDEVILTAKGKKCSLLSLLAEREQILRFKNAVELASKKEPAYEIHVSSRYSEIHDPFFPMFLCLNCKNIRWEPDAYLRIRRKQDGELIEKLFAVVMTVKNETKEELIQKITLYEVFLETKEYRSQLTALQNHYGLMVVIQDEERVKEVQEVLREFKINGRARITLGKDCVAEKIFHEAVWGTEKGEGVAVFGNSLN